MPLDQELIDILACPKCKGGLTIADGAQTLVCGRCRLKYPVRDGIPVMLVEEAIDLSRAPLAQGEKAVGLPRVNFRVTKGPDINMTFQIEQGTCRAIGRAAGDPQKTAFFGVDISLALDEGTKKLILQYIGRQFHKAHAPARATENSLGSFRRAADVTLTDTTLSRLHAMMFADEAGVSILDLVSKNGTYVNNQEVESKLLRKGDIIEFGETEIVFEG